MNPSERFSYTASDVDELRDPFKAALRRELSGMTARKIIYTPALTIAQGTSSASVFALIDTGWIWMAENAEGGVEIVKADFARTTLVESTVVLLLGRLKIDYVDGRAAKCVVVEFNTVMANYYEDLVNELLASMGGTPVRPPNPQLPDLTPLAPLPLKFKNSVLRVLPPGERIEALAWWPAVVHPDSEWIEHEISAETALMVCERELILLAEETLLPGGNLSKGFHIGLFHKFGSVATRIPLSRVEDCRFGGNEEFATMELLLRAGQTVEILTLAFPLDRRQAIQDVMRHGLRLKRGKKK